MSSRTGRRTRDETAAMIREAAVGLLQRDGLRGFSNSVRLDDALNLLLENEGVRLTHGSIYGRIWTDQRDFQLDVVATTVGRYDGADIAAALIAAANDTNQDAGVDGVAGDGPVAAAVGADAPEADPSAGLGSRPVRIEAMFEAAVGAARASRMWNLWLGAHAAVVSTPGPEDDERLAEALDRAQEQVVSTLASALETVTGRAHGTERGGPAQVLLTQLVGVSITRDGAAATKVLIDQIG